MPLTNIGKTDYKSIEKMIILEIEQNPELVGVIEKNYENTLIIQ